MLSRGGWSRRPKSRPTSLDGQRVTEVELDLLSPEVSRVPGGVGCGVGPATWSL